LVDAVADVVELGPGDLHTPPSVAGVMPLEFIRAVARVGEEMLIVLDLNRIITGSPVALAA
jgi:purine-binding chemotaxis protein CheW